VVFVAKAKRSIAEIERDLDETTQRLAGDVDEFMARLRPSRMARAGLDDAKRRLGASSSARRTEVIAAVAGAAVVGLVLWRLSKR
jgi:hypothetical protein